MTERERLTQARQPDQPQPWLQWGPYLSERQWGTVREDYSPDGDAWNYLSYDEARGRAYRWGEDGLAGISDDTQTLCLALTLWNGQDDHLKERLFGLTNTEGNHGEDVKELYYYLDNTPTHSYQKFLYKYPQAAFPYQALREQNAARSAHDPEFELLDTGVLADNRYFDVAVEYAKAGPTDLLLRLTASNRGPEPAELHLLPTLWFRNRWSFGLEAGRPELRRGEAGRLHARHARLGDYTLCFAPPDELLLTENDTATPEAGPLVKDAFHAALLPGADLQHPSRTAVTGTKAAPVYRRTLAPGETWELRLRLLAGPAPADPLGEEFAAVLAARQREADEFYAALLPDTPPALAAVKRQAWAGVLWSKQYYNYDVARWLSGDPGQPAPPPGRGEVRNGDWADLKAEHILLMPDKWEYPWFAAWDLVFHCVALAPVDWALAKQQCLLLATPPFAHADGRTPSYEFDFSNANPPVQGQSAWLLYEYGQTVLGECDHDFLREALRLLLPSHAWWMERFHRSPEESFKGSFLGLDNASLLDREQVPGGGYLKQVDGLSWLAGYTLYLMRAALELAAHEPGYEETAIRLFRDFEEIGGELADIAHVWDGVPGLGDTGFHYDVLVEPGGRQRPVPLRSILGLAPLFGKLVLEPHTLAYVPAFVAAVEKHLTSQWAAPRYPTVSAPDDGQRWLFSLIPRQKLEQVLPYLFDEAEMLGPAGIRSLSKAHQQHPATMEVAGQTYSAAYVPGESDSDVMGGNSNWRGPVWLPLNFVLLLSLRRLSQFYADALPPVELPRGSGRRVPLAEAVRELAARMQSSFLPDAQGRRPIHGAEARYATDPHFRDLLLFYEYLDGDTGRGCGASHQTGWTALVALLDRL